MRTFRTIVHPTSACKKHPYEVQELQGAFSFKFFAKWKTIETCDSPEDARNYANSLDDNVHYLGVYDLDGISMAKEPNETEIHYVPK